MLHLSTSPVQTSATNNTCCVRRPRSVGFLPFTVLSPLQPLQGDGRVHPAAQLHLQKAERIRPHGCVRLGRPTTRTVAPQKSVRERKRDDTAGELGRTSGTDGIECDRLLDLRCVYTIQHYCGSGAEARTHVGQAMAVAVA